MACMVDMLPSTGSLVYFTSIACGPISEDRLLAFRAYYSRNSLRKTENVIWQFSQFRQQAQRYDNIVLS